MAKRKLENGSLYEDLRMKNMEDNKIMLQKLMSDLETNFPVKIEPPARRTRRSHTGVEKVGPIRRNPSRSARFSQDNTSPPRTRSRRGSVASSICSSSSSSMTTPDSSPNKLQVRFGFFMKPGRRQEEADDVDSLEGFIEDENEKPRRPYCVHDQRSPEEITQDDLDRVAEFVSEKKYDSFYGSTCHQCRQKTDDVKTICRSGNCFGVRGKFCGPCLRNRYGEDAKLALKNPGWICPPCRGICNCSFCRKKNGKSCTGILIHLARENGFSNVNDYLHSFKS